MTAGSDDDDTGGATGWADVLTAARTAADRRLTADERPQAVAYIRRTPARVGERIGPAVDVTAPFDSWVVFVDLLPDRNWAHPVRYVFVDVRDPAGERSQTVDAAFPPWFGPLPDDYELLFTSDVSGRSAQKNPP